MKKQLYRIKKDLDFNELEIEDEIGEFEIIGESKNSIIIESEDEIIYRAKISKVTNHLQIEQVGYESFELF